MIRATDLSPLMMMNLFTLGFRGADIAYSFVDTVLTINSAILGLG